MNPPRYSAYAFLIILAVVYFVSGTFITNQFGPQDNKNLLITELSQTSGVQLGPKLSSVYAQQRISRRDRIFWVDYEYQLNFAVPAGTAGGEAINFSVKLPGKVTSTNADREDELFWESAPVSGNMFANTRSIRWWLIGIALALIGINIFLVARKKALQ